MRRRMRSEIGSQDWGAKWHNGGGAGAVVVYRLSVAARRDLELVVSRRIIAEATGEPL